MINRTFRVYSADGTPISEYLILDLDGLQLGPVAEVLPPRELVTGRIVVVEEHNPATGAQGMRRFYRVIGTELVPVTSVALAYLLM